MKRSELMALCFGFGLVLFGIFIALSLVTWSVHDPQVLPNFEEGARLIRNKCGIGGSFISSFLFRVHGAAAYAVPIAMLALGSWLVRNRTIDSGFRRASGAVLLIIGLSLLSGTLTGTWVARLFAERSLEGPGGSFGGRPVIALTRLMGGAGMYLVMLFVFGAGAILASREIVEKILEATGGAFVFAGPAIVRAAKATLGLFPGRKKFASTQELLSTLPPLAQRVRAATTALPKALPRHKKIEPPTVRFEPPENKAEVADARISLPVAKPSGRPKRISSIAEITTRRLRPKAEEREEHSGGYMLPTADVLIKDDARSEVNKDELAQRGVQIVNTFSEFSIETRLVGYEPGPSLTLYEFELAPGIKLNRVTGLADNLAMAVMSPNVRVIAPLPGKSTIGVEVPNMRTDIVRMRPILEGPELAEEECAIPLIFGRDAGGHPLIADLAAMPHLLVAGASGSGKSVAMHSMVTSILMLKRPDEVRLILVDPKMVEFSRYRSIPHLASPVVTEVKRAAGVLDWAVQEMQTRYQMLSSVGARDIASYNKLSAEERKDLTEDSEDTSRLEKCMPYIVIMVDELADLMMVASKEVEYSITRLAQKSRATGIHLVLATQRPSVDVVTGLIKSNISCRIAFHVTARIDSSVILDRPGAEKLLGQGDMLYISPGYPTPVRAKGVYLSDEEIRRVVEHVRGQDTPEQILQIAGPSSPEDAPHSPEATGSTVDSLYDEAVRIVLGTNRGSVSLLQRRLGIGYTRAGKLIDMMAGEGILGPYRGSKSRDINMTLDEWEAQQVGRKLSA